MQQIIQLRPEDDIATIRARIQAADLARIVLVVPRNCWALQSERGLQLLRRAADDSGAHVALVAHDERVREYAEEYGFPIFNSLAQAQRARWRMLPPLRATGLRLAPPPPTAPESTRPFAWASDWIREWRRALALLAGALLMLCLAAFFLVPTAQVRIVPAYLALTTTTDIVVDSSIGQINAETRAIPARRLLRDISGTAQLQTTTTKNIPNARATGTVIFTNLRAEETMIPPGAIVKTSAGVPIRFTTTTTTTVPAGIGSRAEAPVQAVDPGPSGNVKALAINVVEGSLALVVRVINTKPMVSGNLRAVKVVTADDKKKLEEQLLQQLKQQAPSLLRAMLKPGEFIPPDSVLVDVVDQQFDHAVDEPAEVLNLKMTASAFGLAVEQENVQALMSLILKRQMQTGYDLLPNGVRVEVLPGGKFQGIQLRQPIRAIGYTTPQLDAAKVARAVQGKSVDEAKQYLSNAVSLAQPPEIRVTPPGWLWMPWLAFRIAVFIEPQAAAP